MIEIPVHNQKGEPVDKLEVDETLLGGEVRPGLLKQAYVRYHSNLRQGSAKNKSRAETAFSTRKLYKQKGTGNARRGSAGTNIMRKGGRAFARRPRSFRIDMPDKMRRLANCNAVLAKVVDNEIRVVDSLGFDKPSTRQFAELLSALKIDRNCLVALVSTDGNEARSAANLDQVTLTQIDHINAFNLLNHRYVLVEKAALQAWIDRTGSRSRRSKEAQ